ncbi:MAG: SusC/RagA family TonB-linked outer membrane protein [Bacteroidota bacterium]
MKLNFDFSSKCGVVLLFLLTMVSFSYAQRTITGTITDAGTGDPLIGANILILGTSTGTITDFDGNYSLDLPADATTLRITYTGYADQEVDVTSGTTFNVELSEGTQLDEIVVTGYGTAKSKEVTSAIASIKEEDFNGGSIQSPAQLLQGKVAGLTISRPGGNPNNNFSIRLRSLSSVGADNSPLIIIDGVLGADLNTVDPNDIASIDILKDGSAAAIYGTRGASGVIIITTKKGEAGKATVNYEGFVSAEVIDNTVEVLSAEEFRNFRGGTDGSIVGVDRGSSTDWFDEITRTGITQVHSLSLSGGAKGTSYRFSANYRDVEGIAVNTGFQQLNFRANVQQKALNDRLTLNATITTTNRDSDEGFNGAFRYATIYNPTAPVLDPSNTQNDGYYEETLFDYFNPVAIIEQNLNEQEQRNTILSFRGDYELLPGLGISAFYSQERKDETNRDYIDRNSFGTGQNRTGLASLGNGKDLNELFETTANYTTDFGGTELKLLAGYSFQEFTSQGFGVSGGNFITDAFTYNNLGASLDFPNGLGGGGSGKETDRLIAFFGQASLNFNDTYFLRGSLRREGSSRFGANNKWGLFPAISGGVNLVKILDIPSVDNLKLRAGYGVTGTRPPARYISLQRFAPGDPFFFDGAYIPSYGPASNPNPDLKWEEKADINIGLDFALFDFAVTGSLDYFDTQTSDMGLTFPVPVPPNQFGSTFLNVGELSNSGLEFQVTYNAINNENFSWNTSVNGIYFIENTFESFSNEELGVGQNDRPIGNLGSPGQNQTPLVFLAEGEPIGQIFGLKFEGIDDDGRWIFEDTDGDGVRNEDEDRQILGNGLPDLQMGWNNSFTFGRLDVNFFFRGVFGHDMVNTFRAFYEAPSTITSYNILASSQDVINLTDAPTFSSFHVEDASFVKLDNATIGYTFGLPENSAFSNIRLYVSGNNLITITGYDGVDPEVRLVDDPDGDGNGNPLIPGIDRRNTYFRAQSFVFGVQLGL